MISQERKEKKMSRRTPTILGRQERGGIRRTKMKGYKLNAAQGKRHPAESTVH